MEALDYAAWAHGDQKVPGKEYSYIVHLATVCMEILAAVGREEQLDADLAVQCALLHDVIEDAGVSFEALQARFGESVAQGVLALSKNAALTDKKEKMIDSLERIRMRPREIWMVKIADRICNLQEPPRHWSREKRARYQEEARFILEELGAASPYLAGRLQAKIDAYSRYIAK